MTDTFDKTTRSWIMSRVKGRGTRPEIRVASELSRRRIKYQQHRQDLPGCPDFVFPRLRLVVFVNGCFWHWHGCIRCRMPSSNRKYWQWKIERNRLRDKEHRR